MAQIAPHQVVAITYDQLWPFEFGIAAEIFGWNRPELESGWYEFRVAGPGSPVRSIGGLSLSASHDYEIIAEADTVIIPAWRDVHETPTPDLLAGLLAAHDAGKRIVSYCTGAFVLAHAGLLGGHRATTHWRHIPLLREAFPDIDVVEDVLYVEDRNIVTSAGSSAAIDASLHVIRQDYGSAVANKVARSLITPPHRDGGQSQYIEAPYQERTGKSVAGVLDWAREQLDRPLEISEMAAFAGMSERTFLRRFREGTGTTPLKWLRRERIFRAMGLLEKTCLDVADVSDQSGFGSVETFRTAFREIAGVPPHTYRKRFEGVIQR
ncbi:helix-turn-helix domain-containing protein [Henriciella sp.]|uniref:helix-turn-helix domain-containing protein n=1 Tax=Henriciella sp. TaxID=1968823 RepID=UPI00260EF479|nr:helix-turn-helix domain-containing protein [Henriciella sp.]